MPNNTLLGLNSYSAQTMVYKGTSNMEEKKSYDCSVRYYLVVFRGENDTKPYLCILAISCSDSAGGCLIATTDAYLIHGDHSIGNGRWHPVEEYFNFSCCVDSHIVSIHISNRARRRGEFVSHTGYLIVSWYISQRVCNTPYHNQL